MPLTELEREELLLEDITLLEDESDDDVADEVERLELEDTVLLRTEDELDDTAATWYMFNLFDPPQYSLALFLQTREQPETLGTLLVWLTDPVLIVLPQ